MTGERERRERGEREERERRERGERGCAYLPIQRGAKGAGAPIHVREELARAAEAEGIRVRAFRRLVAGVPVTGERERERES